MRRLASTSMGWALLCAALPAWGGVDSWSPASPGGGRVRRLIVDPTSALKVYAEIDGDGPYLSVDGGESWARIARGLARTPPFDLVLDPAHPRTLYLHTVETVDGGSIVRLFRSEDGARSWQPLETEAPASFRVLAVAPEDPPVLYGVGLDGGSNLSILRSRDGGASFQAVRSLDPPAGPVPVVVDPYDPKTVYAGGIQGVLKSRDGGDTWTVLNQVVSGEAFGSPYHLAVAGGDAEVLYASRFGALYRSQDGGATWSQKPALPPGCGVYALAVDPWESQRVYSGCDLGVALSTDGGDTWTRLTTGLPVRPEVSLPDGFTEPITALAVAAAEPPRIYAGSFGQGVFRSGNGGRRWVAASRGLAPRDVLALSPIPGSAASFEALIPDANGCPQPQVSHDAGATWTALATAPACAAWSVLVVDRALPATIYLGGDLGLWESRDEGRSWSRLFAGRVAVLSIDPTNPRRLLVGGAGAHRSTNGGRSWQSVIAGRIGTTSYGVRQILHDPTRPGTVYATGESGFVGSSNGIAWKSLDGGRRWREIPSPGSALQVLPGQPSVLFTDNGFESADGGATWSLTGFPGQQWLVVGASGVLYAADRTTVFRSEDRGASWRAVGDWQGCSGEFPRLESAHPLAPERLFAAGCLGDLAVAQWLGATPLVLAGGRLEVRSAWRLAEGRWGAGSARPFTSGSGFLSLDGRASPLAGVKVIDARALSGRFWLFLTSLSFAEQTFTVLDRATGASVDFFHPAGAPASFSSSSALPAPPETPEPDGPVPPGPAGLGEVFLLSGRFRARLGVSLPGGLEIPAQGLALGDGVATFWSQRPESPEVMLRLIDGRRANGHFWLVAGGLTSLSYSLEISDLASGRMRRIFHEAGAPLTQTDLAAFPP